MKQEIGLAEKFKRLVKMQREFLDISTPEIAAASRVSVWTHCAHLRNPGKITLTEMQYLCKKLGITVVLETAEMITRAGK